LKYPYFQLFSFFIGSGSVKIRVAGKRKEIGVGSGEGKNGPETGGSHRESGREAGVDHKE